MDKFDIIKSYLLDEGFAETEEAAIGMMVSMSESWKEEILEGYKGKHGQSDKEYADSRSQGGKMVSGDSKMSGAEYTHGRRVKAANPGMQPDVGGKTKSSSLRVRWTRVLAQILSIVRQTSRKKNLSWTRIVAQSSFCWWL